MNDPVFGRIKSKIKMIVKREPFLVSDNNRAIYIFLAPDYGNFGDIAISYAQRIFFKNIFPEYKVVEIPLSKFYNYLLGLKKIIKKNDIVAVMGGGNMSDLYEYYEEIRRQTIKAFPNNLIVSFPQTISFSDNKNGEKSLNRSIEIYSKHKKLILFAREKKSYLTMKEYFQKNDVFLMPDMVFYLAGKVGSNDCTNNTIGLCLRTDVERLIDVDTEKRIKSILKDYKFKNIKTHTQDNNIKFDKKDEQFLAFLNEIKEIKLLITDRLHGMLFSYITGTPCIAFDNNNHKIRESYNAWLEECDYIKVIDEDDIDNLNSIVKEILNSKRNTVNLDEEFKSLENIIKSSMRTI